jgi:hypothetical protein
MQIPVGVVDTRRRLETYVRRCCVAAGGMAEVTGLKMGSNQIVLVITSSVMTFE